MVDTSAYSEKSKYMIFSLQDFLDMLRNPTAIFEGLHGSLYEIRISSGMEYTKADRDTKTDKSDAQRLPGFSLRRPGFENLTLGQLNILCQNGNTDATCNPGAVTLGISMPPFLGGTGINYPIDLQTLQVSGPFRNNIEFPAPAIDLITTRRNFQPPPLFLEGPPSIDTRVAEVANEVPTHTNFSLLQQPESVEESSIPFDGLEDDQLSLGETDTRLSLPATPKQQENLNNLKASDTIAQKNSLSLLDIDDLGDLENQYNGRTTHDIDLFGWNTSPSLSSSAQTSLSEYQGTHQRDSLASDASFLSEMPLIDFEDISLNARDFMPGQTHWDVLTGVFDKYELIVVNWQDIPDGDCESRTFQCYNVEDIEEKLTDWLSGNFRNPRFNWDRFQLWSVAGQRYLSGVGALAVEVSERERMGGSKIGTYRVMPR